MKLTKNTIPQARNYPCDKCKGIRRHADMYDDDVCYWNIIWNIVWVVIIIFFIGSIIYNIGWSRGYDKGYDAKYCSSCQSQIDDVRFWKDNANDWENLYNQRDINRDYWMNRKC